MIDSHCHLDFFDNIESVIEKSIKAAVDKFIVPGIGSSNWQKVLDLSVRFNSIYPALGIHPWLISFHKQAIEQLSSLVKQKKLIAIGECGLDFFKGRDNEKLQRQVFLEQIKLARAHKLPLIIHSTRAVEDIYKILKDEGMSQGVFHWFSGSIEQALKIIDLGFFIGIGGLITKSDKLKNVVRELPLDKILLETDSPDQGVDGLNDKTPANIPAIVRELARIKQMEFAATVKQCDINANTCFGI